MRARKKARKECEDDTWTMEETDTLWNTYQSLWEVTWDTTMKEVNKVAMRPKDVNEIRRMWHQSSRNIEDCDCSAEEIEVLNRTYPLLWNVTWDATLKAVNNVATVSRTMSDIKEKIDRMTTTFSMDEDEPITEVWELGICDSDSDPDVLSVETDKCADAPTVAVEIDKCADTPTVAVDYTNRDDMDLQSQPKIPQIRRSQRLLTNRLRKEVNGWLNYNDAQDTSARVAQIHATNEVARDDQDLESQPKIPKVQKVCSKSLDAGHFCNRTCK